MIHKAGNPEKLMYIQSISTSEFIHSSCGILSRGDQVVQFSSSSQPLKKGEIGQDSGMKGKHQLEMTARSEDTSSTSSECKMWNIRCKCLLHFQSTVIVSHGFPGPMGCLKKLPAAEFSDCQGAWRTTPHTFGPQLYPEVPTQVMGTCGCLDCLVGTPILC